MTEDHKEFTYNNINSGILFGEIPLCPTWRIWYYVNDSKNIRDNRNTLV